MNARPLARRREREHMDGKNFSAPIPQPKRPPEEGAPRVPEGADAQPQAPEPASVSQPMPAAPQDASGQEVPAQPVPQPASAPAEEPAPQPASAPQPAQPQQPNGAYPQAVPGAPQGAQQPYGAPAQPQPQQPYGIPAQPQPQPQQPYPGQPPYVSQQPMGAGVKQKGTASLVCGIVAIVIALLMPPLALVSLILGIVAIVLSVKAVTATGKTIKTTAGKVCGVVGIIISAIMLILIAIGFSLINADLADTGSSTSASSSLTADASSDERAVEALAIERLDLLKNQDSAVVSEIAADVDATFEEATDVSHADLGANAEDVARWMLTDFDYTISSVYVDDDDSASVYASVEMRDTYAFLTTFYDEVEAWSESSAGKNASQSEAMAKVGEIYQDAMESTDTMTSYYAGIYFDKKGNDWVIDEDEWDDEMSYMFGLYG